MIITIKSNKRRAVWSPCLGSRRWSFGTITIRAAYIR